jgi:uncharacterized membrane protein
VAKPNRTLAWLAYLIPFLGPLLVFLTGRKNGFALYHACQALAVHLLAVLTPLAWMISALAVAWIPIAGPVVAAGLFALVIAAYGALFVAWVMGIVHVSRQQLLPVPIFGDWGMRLFGRFSAASA